MQCLKDDASIYAGKGNESFASLRRSLSLEILVSQQLRKH
jgi:hypothetical protein